MKTIRILIADDHAAVRRGLALLLNLEPDFEVVGEAPNGAMAVSMIFDTVPDLVLLDWNMPRKDGITAAQEIKRNMSSVRTLLYSGMPIKTAALDALGQGIDGFIHKNISPDGLAHAIRAVAKGQRYLGPEVAEALIEYSRQMQTAVSPPANNHPIPLSPRELEVLELMSTSATYREIGAQLSISESTVRTHTKRILTKLSQPNRAQAVIVALRLGLISLD